MAFPNKDLLNKELTWTLDLPWEEDSSPRTAQFEFFWIVGNVLRNAEKFGDKTVRITVKDCRGVVEIVVEDDGSGFPLDKEERDLLLKWGHRATLHNAYGSGIGLALAAEWLRGGKGSIELSRSSELTGACVTIRVQCVEAGS